MRINRQSRFGYVVFLVCVGAKKSPDTKHCAAIINDLAYFTYLPCSRQYLVLHLSLKQKNKCIPFILYVVP